MIVSASRRTDIPAFYSDWFFRRLEEGYLCKESHRSQGKVNKILLSRIQLTALLSGRRSWDPMMERLSVFGPAGVSYYFSSPPDTLWDGCGTRTSP